MLETVENTVVLFSSVAEGKMELENINDGSHEVSSKLKPSINLEFIEWFVGISEAESNFLCLVFPRRGKTCA